MSVRVRLIPGDCLRVMRLMAALGIQADSIVCDPPYHLTSIVKRFGADGSAEVKPGKTGAYKRASAGFMGKKWDGGDIAFQRETWELAMAVLKPGGHLLAFGGTRGWHRMACAIEDAGFEIRDTVAWLYGSGFPKSHDVSKGIDKAAGADREKVQPGNPPAYQRSVGNRRPWMDDADHKIDSGIPATPEAEQWQGWGTALKPAFEPIVLARKPLSESSVAANVLRHGVGALNVDGCRIETSEDLNGGSYGGTTRGDDEFFAGKKPGGAGVFVQPEGRWPANVCTDGSAEVEAAFAAFGESKSTGGSGEASIQSAGPTFQNLRAGAERMRHGGANFGGIGDSGTASRFFYSSKAGPQDRFGSKHPTVKPVSLMRWLVRLVTQPGGLVLDPFAGSGSTGIAAIAEGMRAILIENDPEHQADIREHLAWATGEGRHALASKARNKEGARHDDLPLFLTPEAAE